MSAGEIVVLHPYAGLDYKNCLSLRERAKIIASYPRVVGIQLVGEVVASSVAAFEPGPISLKHRSLRRWAGIDIMYRTMVARCLPFHESDRSMPMCRRSKNSSSDSSSEKGVRI